VVENSLWREVRKVERRLAALGFTLNASQMEVRHFGTEVVDLCSATTLVRFQRERGTLTVGLAPRAIEGEDHWPLQHLDEAFTGTCHDAEREPFSVGEAVAFMERNQSWLAPAFEPAQCVNTMIRVKTNGAERLKRWAATKAR
jgi:hypothetical protein